MGSPDREQKYYIMISDFWILVLHPKRSEENLSPPRSSAPLSFGRRGVGGEVPYSVG
jgi:hypothetical protein